MDAAANGPVVIENVTDTAISISIDGEIQEIRKELAALVEFLKKARRNSFQNAQNIYNIQNINEANFGFAIGELGKKQFNQLLTKKLIEALSETEPYAAELLAKARENNENNWETSIRFGTLARRIIVLAYVGTVSIQLEQLIALGKEEWDKTKQTRYVELGICTATRAIELVCFTMLSVLWDNQKTAFAPIPDPQKRVLKNFFEDRIERDLRVNLELLRALHVIFIDRGLAFPIPELAGIGESIAPGGSLAGPCEELHALNRLLDRSEIEFKHCFEMEQHLASLLSGLSFLTQYKMVSIKNIGYHEIRCCPAAYLYSIAELNTDSTGNPVIEARSYRTAPTCTDSVILYQHQYQEGVNLFPFIININGLTLTSGSRICFYGSKGLSRNTLNYKLLDTNLMETIMSQQIRPTPFDPDYLLMDERQHKQFKLDMVASLFEDAKNTILGRL